MRLINLDFEKHQHSGFLDIGGVPIIESEACVNVPEPENASKLI